MINAAMPELYAFVTIFVLLNRDSSTMAMLFHVCDCNPSSNCLVVTMVNLRTLTLAILIPGSFQLANGGGRSGAVIRLGTFRFDVY